MLNNYELKIKNFFSFFLKKKKKAQMKQFFSENCKNLIEGLLEVNPKKRLGANGVEEI